MDDSKKEQVPLPLSSGTCSSFVMGNIALIIDYLNQSDHKLKRKHANKIIPLRPTFIPTHRGV